MPHRIGRPLLCALLVAGCGLELEGPQSALTADGPGAQAILDLGVVLTALSVFVVALVTGTLLYALFRRRDPGTSTAEVVTARVVVADEATVEAATTQDTAAGKATKSATNQGVTDTRTTQRGNVAASDATGHLAAARATTSVGTASIERRTLRWILGGGVILPVVTLVPLFFFALGTLGRVSPSTPPDLVLEVTGRQFWWEVRYLDAQNRELFETANEIHIPVGREVEVRLRSEDVIHSFWVPRLAPKLDNVPGHTTVLRLRADEPGPYRGQCAEYCGVQHAHMAFLVLAEPEDVYGAWSTTQAAAAVQPSDPLAVTGQQVFLESCAQCHAVRGTPAAGDIGPDLTHVASRTTLAAGLLPNSAGHQAGWIVNPQALKAGSLMPALPLEPRELDALLSYLAGLR